MQPARGMDAPYSGRSVSELPPAPRRRTLPIATTSAVAPSYSTGGRGQGAREGSFRDEVHNGAARAVPGNFAAAARPGATAYHLRAPTPPASKEVRNELHNGLAHAVPAQSAAAAYSGATTSTYSEPKDEPVVPAPARRPRKHEIAFLITTDESIDAHMLRMRTSPVSGNSLSPGLLFRDPTAPDATLRLPAPMARVDVSCSECGACPGTSEALALHARTQHPMKPFACRVCGRCFGEKGNMNKHFRTVHLKQRRHTCATCGKQFAFLDGLNRHVSMVHLDRRPFECIECMCPGGPHAKEVACTHICGMRFKQKSHRRRHILSVHRATNPPACQRCGVKESGHVCEEAGAILGEHRPPTLR